MGSPLFSWIIFFLPALALIFRAGTGSIELALLLALCCYAVPLWRQRLLVPVQARWIVIAFALNLAGLLCSMAINNTPLNFLDYPLRQLLATSAIGLIVLTRPRTRFFWIGLNLGALLACALALYQIIVLGLPRALGPHQAIVFGDIAMVMGMMALAALVPLARTRFALLPLAGCAAGITASALSGSRGGWLALVLVVVPMIAYGSRGFGRRLALTLLGLLMAAILGAFVPRLGVAQRIDDTVRELRQYDVGNSQTSAGARLQMWKGAVLMFQDHPLLGVGPANFSDGLNRLIERHEIDPSARDFGHAHNDMLNALATGGLLGGLSLLLMYGAPLLFFSRVARRGDANKPVALAGIMLVVGYLLFGLTQAMFSHHLGASFYALMVAVLAGLCLLEPVGAEAAA